MPDMNGIVLAARIKERWPDANILFLTAYREFAFDAFSVHPCGYLLKPVTLDALQKEIDYTKSICPRLGQGHRRKWPDRIHHGRRPPDPGRRLHAGREGPVCPRGQHPDHLRPEWGDGQALLPPSSGGAIGGGDGVKRITTKLSWTGESKDSMSVYASSFTLNVTLEKNFKNQENGTSYPDGNYNSKLDSLNRRTLVPDYTPEFTVTFDSDGGSSVETQAIGSSGKAVKHTDPTKTGCSFQGWYLVTGDTLADTAFDFNTARRAARPGASQPRPPAVSSWPRTPKAGTEISKSIRSPHRPPW